MFLKIIVYPLIGIIFLGLIGFLALKIFGFPFNTNFHSHTNSYQLISGETSKHYLKDSSNIQGNDLWDKPIIQYDSSEIKDSIFSSEENLKIISSLGDRVLIANSCSDLIKNYFYGFPGYKYDKITARLESYRTSYDPTPKSDLRIDLSASYKTPDYSYLGESHDYYTFMVKITADSKCSLSEEFTSMRRELIPKEMQERIINLVKKDSLVQNRLKKDNLKPKFYGWSSLTTDYDLKSHPDDLPDKNIFLQAKSTQYISLDFEESVGDCDLKTFNVDIDIQTGYINVDKFEKGDFNCAYPL